MAASQGTWAEGANRLGGSGPCTGYALRRGPLYAGAHSLRRICRPCDTGIGRGLFPGPAPYANLRAAIAQVRPGFPPVPGV